MTADVNDLNNVMSRLADDREAPRGRARPTKFKTAEPYLERGRSAAKRMRAGRPRSFVSKIALAGDTLKCL
jgi:hypothetical protein